MEIQRKYASCEIKKEILFNNNMFVLCEGPEGTLLLCLCIHVRFHLSFLPDFMYLLKLSILPPPTPPTTFGINYLALARSQLPTSLDQLRSNSLAIVHIMAILELPNTFYFWCITHSITSYTSTFLNIFPQIILKFTSNTSVT